MFLRYVIRFSFLGFSFSVSPSASLPLQLESLCHLYSSALRLSSAVGSLYLVSTCSPSFPLIFLHWLLLLLSSFFLLLRSLFFLFALVSLSREFALSCLFSLVGNAVQGCLSVKFSFVSRLLFLCSGFVFYAPEGGGGLPCFSFAVHCTGVLRCLSLPPSGMFCPFLFSFAFGDSLPFGLRLAVSTTPVSGTCFRLSFSLLKLRFVFFALEVGGGWSPVLFVFCETEWDILMFFSSNLRGVFLFLFSFCFGVPLPLGLRLAFFIVPVSCACFPASSFLFVVVRCLSDCRLPLLFFSVVLRFQCVSSFLWAFVSSLSSLPCLLPAFLFLVALPSALLRLLVLSFLAVGSGMLFYTLCSPFFAAMALPCARSGFPVSLACSVLLPLCLGVLFLVCLFTSVPSSPQLSSFG